MNTLEFSSIQSKMNKLQECLTKAVSHALSRMDDSALDKLMRSPLQDFQTEDAKLAA